MRKPKTHWNKGCRIGIGSHTVKIHYNALAFVEASKTNPDWYCVPCATKARLALAAESAPKPSDVVWPKPRPIIEAPKDTRVDSSGVFCNVTHFLPLPPEVRR